MTARCPFSSRRGFLAAAAALGAASGLTARAQGAAPAPMEPFAGVHQGGILTPQQSHTCFAAFDLVTSQPADIPALLARWTSAAARMSAGLTAAPLAADLTVAAMDSGEAAGLPAARLTVTFGFGAGLFVKDGRDRFGLAARRPEALVDMPAFNGDQLVPERTSGDLSVQACADDPQVAFHALRQLTRLARGVAQLRWMQNGFSTSDPAGQTPRNLMGFRDGTQNPAARHAAGPDGADATVWIGDEGPDWMRGGSYAVMRRIRIALEHWDGTDTEFQQQVVGRQKESGAPLGGRAEADTLDLDALDADANPVIPDDAHVRLAAAATNGGAQMLRRGYSYNDGATFTAERWPPWRQGMMFDAGLLFVAYQRDPRTGFIRVNETLSRLDAMNQYTTHTGSGLFACPGGVPAREVAAGGFVGARLFT